MDQLFMSLNEAGLMLKMQTDQGEVDFILLETNDSGTTQSVNVNTFEMLFEDVKGDSTYKALSGSHTFQMGDTQYTMIAEEMGYQEYFDQWEEQGMFKS